MKLKELYKKYDPDYYICVFGKPLNTPTIPFTHLPLNWKEIEEMEVIEMEIEDKPYIEKGISFKTMKPTKPIHRKGNIYVYVRKETNK